MKITKAKLKITKAKLATIIKEEYTSALATESEWRGAGTVHSDGLMDMIRDFVTNEVSGWHDVAKATLHKEIAENGFDISEIVMTALGGEVKEELSVVREQDAQSLEDLSAKVSEATSALEQVMIDYVESGWLEAQDHASLAENLSGAFNAMDMLRNTFINMAK